MRARWTRLPSLGEEGNEPTQHLPNKVEAYVLLSKSYRWPEEHVPTAIELLDEASQLVESTSRPEDRVDLRSRVACGLARLGQFYKARGFAEGASLDDNLELAQRELADQYETAEACRVFPRGTRRASSGGFAGSSTNRSTSDAVTTLGIGAPPPLSRTPQ